MGMILLAFGLVLIVEGLAYALAPSLVERMLEALRALPESARRNVGDADILKPLDVAFYHSGGIAADQ